MADINIERKSQSIWPWIVGLLLLAVVVFVVLQYFKGRNTDADGVVTDTTVQTPQFQPAPAPAVTTDPVVPDTTRRDSIPATTTSAL